MSPPKLCGKSTIRIIREKRLIVVRTTNRMDRSVHSLQTITVHIVLKRSIVTSEARSDLDILGRCLRGISLLLWHRKWPWKEWGLPRLVTKLNIRSSSWPLPATTYP
jgi:hypothetical protein